ncbi:Hypothetical protein NocV09_07300080 [Nannochloropsis oceanica]
MHRRGPDRGVECFANTRHEITFNYIFYNATHMTTIFLDPDVTRYLHVKAMTGDHNTVSKLLSMDPQEVQFHICFSNPLQQNPPNKQSLLPTDNSSPILPYLLMLCKFSNALQQNPTNKQSLLPRKNLLKLLPIPPHTCSAG